jgi:hypothetical protein
MKGVRWEDQGTKGVPVSSFLLGLAAVLYMFNGFVYVVNSGGIDVGGWIVALLGVLLLVLAKSYYDLAFWAWGLVVVISPLMAILYFLSLAFLELALWCSVFLGTIIQWSLFKEELFRPRPSS